MVDCGPLARTTAHQRGNYQLKATCTPEVPETQMWIEAEAAGYWMASSREHASPLHWSDPPIYCTREPQVVDLSLRAPPTVTIRGQIVTAQPSPAPIPRATVRLKTFYNPETVATTTSDAAGTYELSYKYPSASPCEPADGLSYIVEASADGYVTATAAAEDPNGPFVSDPPIYCTSDPQVINLSMQPVSN